MPLPPSTRFFLPLGIGLTVGLAGATLFLQSLPGDEGSPEARAQELEVELKRANNRIAALEAGSGGKEAGHPRRTFRDEARRIAEDIRAGRPVSPDDVFRATQPLMRDLTPLFDRIRMREQQHLIDSKTGELAREYDLPPEKQALLKEWFKQKKEEEAESWNALIARDDTRLQDVIRASQDVRTDEGLEEIMPSILSGEQLERFRSDWLEERARRVEREADGKVQQLDGIVGLDEVQRDQIFGIMARNSKDYDPQMDIEGTGAVTSALAPGNPQQAMLSVLRPDQRAAYEAEKKRRREEAEKDMAAIGLTLPPDWEMFGQDNFP